MRAPQIPILWVNPEEAELRGPVPYWGRALWVGSKTPEKKGLPVWQTDTTLTPIPSAVLQSEFVTLHREAGSVSLSLNLNGPRGLWPTVYSGSDSVRFPR